MNIYFVSSFDRNKDEKRAIKKAKPEHILISFYYANKDMKVFTDFIGYKPKIMLDSGAYSAWKSEKELLIDDYINYIKENTDYIDEYIAFDCIGNPEKTYKNYIKMLDEELNPIPVYHYGSDIFYLEKYLQNTNRIALGNTVPIRNKNHVANWINHLISKYPDSKFHLLGSTSKAIIKNCPGLVSCDSTTYSIRPAMGKPKFIDGKVDKMIYWINEILEEDKKPKIERLSMF